MFQWPKRGDGSQTAGEPFRDIGDLKGQVAVISGSTSGIGLAFGRLFQRLPYLGFVARAGKFAVLG